MKKSNGSILLILLLVFACLVMSWFVIGLTYKVFAFLLGGLILGAVARLVYPGSENITIGETVLAGAAGSMAGYIVSHIVHIGSITGWLVSLVFAVLAVAVLNMASSSTTGDTAGK